MFFLEVQALFFGQYYSSNSLDIHYFYSSVLSHFKYTIMRNSPILACLVIFVGFISCNTKTEKEKPGLITEVHIDNPILGTWIKSGPAGETAFTFKENGIVEGDFGKDGAIDIKAVFSIHGDTISFADKEGVTCPNIGTYKMYQSKYYTSFDLIDDDCGGRIKNTIGFWTRPNFEDFFNELDKKIKDNPEIEDYLSRARIFLAIGASSNAKKDFDIYIEENPNDARVFVNRAATRFPNDLSGVVFDCNKAIDLDSKNKYAYFLRGLARYDLGEKAEACTDFEKAIDLGFSVLRIAEEHRCSEFWNAQ